MTEVPEQHELAGADQRNRTHIKHLAYAEASLMLLECLMLKLIERRVLTSNEMVEIIEDAVATKRQMVEEGEHPEISAVASGVLLTLANSLAAINPGSLEGP